MRVAAAFDLAQDSGLRGRAIAAEGSMSDSLAFSRAAGDSLLATHAGLTAGAWKLLNRPGSAQKAAAVLNQVDHPVVWREGEIITGVNDWAAGPLWAVAGSEVYSSWMGLESDGVSKPGFAQAHGHTSARAGATVRGTTRLTNSRNVRACSYMRTRNGRSRGRILGARHSSGLMRQQGTLQPPYPSR
jgi:hypothetical protein